MSSEPVRSPAARLVRRVVLLLFSLACAVFAADCAVRIFDPLGVSQYSDMIRYNTQLLELVPGERIAAQRKDAVMQFRDFAIRTNTLGLRGPEIKVPKPKGQRRLLFLGDSVVLGWGAPEAVTFVRQSEIWLKDLSIECVNAGQNLFDTTQEAALLAELLAAGLDPDAVLLVFVDNDVDLTRDLLARLTEEQIAAASRPAPGSLTRLWQWVRTDVFTGLNDLFVHLSVGHSAQNQATPAGLAGPAEPPGWKPVQVALRQIRDLCAARNIPFHLLDHVPRGAPAASRPDAFVLGAALERFCAEEKIAWHPFFFTDAEKQRPVRHSASDPHANALGHELLMQKLRPVFKELGYLHEGSRAGSGR